MRPITGTFVLLCWLIPPCPVQPPHLWHAAWGIPRFRSRWGCQFRSALAWHWVHVTRSQLPVALPWLRTCPPQSARMGLSPLSLVL